MWPREGFPVYVLTHFIVYQYTKKDLLNKNELKYTVKGTSHIIIEYLKVILNIVAKEIL